MTRALGALGAFWGLGFFGLFIPIAHFILVPAFCITGIVMAIMKAREDQRLVKVCGACPRCGIVQEFKVGGRFTLERSFVCPHCHNALRFIAGAESGSIKGPPRP